MIKLNNILDKILTHNITETNSSINSICIYTVKALDTKKGKGKPNKKLLRERKIEGWRERKKRELRKRSEIDHLERKCQTEKNKLNTVIEELTKSSRE